MRKMSRSVAQRAALTSEICSEIVEDRATQCAISSPAPGQPPEIYTMHCVEGRRSSFGGAEAPPKHSTL